MFVSEHACRPCAAAGLVSMPWGSVTVVPLTSASARPLALSLGCCGTCTFTFSPVGVLPACVSGSRLIEGVNGSRLHPPSAVDSVRACLQRGSLGSGAPPGRCAAGSSHESASSVERSGSLHERGSVRNGAGWDWPSEAQEGDGFGLPPRHCQPRDWLWRGSAGTPHRVIWLDSSEAICQALLTLVSTAESSPAATEVSSVSRMWKS